MELINGLRKADPRKSGSEPALSLHKAYFKGGTGKHLALLLGLHIQCSFPLFVTLHCWSETHRGSGSNTTKGRGRWKNWRSRADRDDPPAPNKSPVASIECPPAFSPEAKSPFRVPLLAGRKPPGPAKSLRNARRRLRPGLPWVCAEPPARGRPSPVRFPSLSAHYHGGVRDHRPHAGGVRVGRRRRPPQPPSFPGEEQRIAQASGSGGGGGRKDERRKRDLNERR
ncbi:uncharacterized protein LOC112627964 [Theropithecus gelada]|uniref:uncharacterized protein LOC112627964 n=1 Tax=Theropithecus gelada TaxID=9565 RepID=UPI000DC15CBC|nr:uncharacterized protein LOC112627964 [Theropithecus gelada]